MDKKEENLPALENETIRALNTKKIVDGFESVGDYFKYIKNATRWQFYINIVFLALFVLILGGSIVVGVSKGGIDGIWDTRASGRVFNCTSNTAYDIVRNYQDAKVFIDMYNGTCIVYQKNGEK
jgi:hypothetical protein